MWKDEQGPDERTIRVQMDGQGPYRRTIMDQMHERIGPAYERTARGPDGWTIRAHMDGRLAYTLIRIHVRPPDVAFEVMKCAIRQYLLLFFFKFSALWQVQTSMQWLHVS